MAYSILISNTINPNIQTNKQLECRSCIQNLSPTSWGHLYKILSSNNLGMRGLHTPKWLFKYSKKSEFPVCQKKRTKSNTHYSNKKTKPILTNKSFNLMCLLSPVLPTLKFIQSVKPILHSPKFKSFPQYGLCIYNPYY